MHPHIFTELFCILRYDFLCINGDVQRAAKSVFDYINLSAKSSSLKLFMKILCSSMSLVSCSVNIELKSSNLVNIFSDSMISSR